MATTGDDEDVAEIARAAAERLAGEVDEARLPVEVERRLQGGPPGQYVDPVSIAGLVVSIASLALAAYQELRRHTDRPSTEVIERRVRVEAIETSGIAAITPAQRDRIVAVVVEETVHRTSG